MSYDEKAIVKINTDGTVAKCAKGLAAGECGFKAGAKVCGKCGAMAIQVKMVPVDELVDEETDEDMTPEERAKRAMKLQKMKEMLEAADGDDEEDDEVNYTTASKAEVEDVEADAELDMDDDESADMTSEKGWGMSYGKRRKEMSMPADVDGDVSAEDSDEDEEMDAEDQGDKGMRWGKRMMSVKEDDDEDLPEVEDDAELDAEEDAMEGEVDAAEAEMDDEDEEEDEDETMAKGGMALDAPDLEAMRMARLRKLGTKSADIGLDGYICSIERKVYPGSTSVCDDCPGGCMAEKGLPGLLHVEGIAEAMFKGDVIDSGYSSEADMFVVDVQTKSGYVNEVFIDGTTAEVLGFHRLDDSIFEQKSLMEDIELINFNEAAELAVKAIPGSVIAVEPGVFQSFDAFQVEIDGVDGKSYDVFVALDGEVLGWDKWEPEDTDEIEAEAAEIALKRAFSEETRQQMAESGEAMDDGSFPIASEADLRNAIMAHGRAKDVDKAKAHIKKRAADLGLEDVLPEEWKANEKSEGASDDDTGEFLKNLIEFEMLQTEVDDIK